MSSILMRRFPVITFIALSTLQSLSAAPVPVVTEVDWQPLRAQARRLVQATEYLGVPFSEKTKEDLDAVLQLDAATGVGRLQEILDPYCLFDVQINPEMRVKVKRGPAKPVLDEKGWRQFLVKVRNESGTTAALNASSPNAKRVPGSPQNAVADRWLDLMTYDKQPLTETLGGLELEYRIVQLYSRDAGKREARIAFNVGQGTQDLGFRSEVDVLFTCEPAQKVTLKVLEICFVYLR